MMQIDSSGRRSWRNHPLLWLGVALTFFALITARRLSLPPNIFSSVWPMGGALAAGLILLPARQRLACTLASSAAVGLLILMFGNPLRTLVSLFEVLGIAFLALRVCGSRPNFSDLKTLSAYLGMVVVPVSAASALLVHLVEGPDLAVHRTLQWFVGHALSNAVFVPGIITLLDTRRFRALKGPAWELALSLVGIAAAAAGFLFSGDKALAFLIFPAVMLVAFRHGPFGAAAASMLLTVLALAVADGRAPALAAPTGGAFSEVDWIQTFVVVVFLTTLPAAGAVASHARLRGLLARRTATARQARRRADIAAAAKGEFLANMSHEIRTPLNGVIGLADALARTELAPAQRELLNMILTSGKSLTGLLSDALDLARADSGALRIAADPFDIRRAIGEAAFLFESLAREKGLAFEVEFDLDADEGIGDPLRIKQVVSNLISNAVKFTDQGSVRVSTRLARTIEGAGLLQVRVRDTGPGFDDQVKTKLFHRFEQGDNSVTRRYGGSGLGLAIAQRLAEMMGGSLDCDARPGEGAEFVFAVPLALAETKLGRSRPGPSRKRRAGDRATGALRVLLAEDNHINQKVIQAMLGQTVSLTVVSDGQAAVEAFVERDFDVVLMDTHMPVLDGLSAIRRIRAYEQRVGAVRTPIVSLTADAMPQQIDAARAAGADLHLSKPLTGEALLSALSASVQLLEAAAA